MGRTLYKRVKCYANFAQWASVAPGQNIVERASTGSHYGPDNSYNTLLLRDFKFYSKMQCVCELEMLLI